MTAGARLAVTTGVLLGAGFGWSVGGSVGAGIGLALGLTLLVVPFRRQPLLSWAAICLRRNRPMDLLVPSTVANDRCGGGVRYQDGVAVTAIQILGMPFQPTHFTGSTSATTPNSLDLGELFPLMRHGL